MDILLTGANGFLGYHIYRTLTNKAFEIGDLTTLGLADCDINTNLVAEIPRLNRSFDLVLHAAGKAHLVPRTKEEANEFFNVNVKGTKNLITALEHSEKLPANIIFISTVAVYGLDHGENISETQPLYGTTPYALSKIQAEEILIEWCTKNKVTLSILRPSLIAGPNPPGNLGAMINGIKSGKYLSIGNGEARKSILMVQDIANVIPLIMNKGGNYNLCDNNHPSFKELELLISKQLGKSSPKSIPYPIAKTLALIGDLIGNKAPINTSKLEKITSSLTFSNEKAKKELGWEPLDVLDNFMILVK